MKIKDCPTCGTPGLVEHIYDDVFWLEPRNESAGNFQVEGLKGFLCNICGEICSVREQIIYNEKLIDSERDRIRAEKGLAPLPPRNNSGHRVEKI